MAMIGQCFFNVSILIDLFCFQKMYGGLCVGVSSGRNLGRPEVVVGVVFAVAVSIILAFIAGIFGIGISILVITIVAIGIGIDIIIIPIALKNARAYGSGL